MTPPGSSAPIRIDDLAAPRLPLLIRAGSRVAARVAPRRFSLDEESLLAEAARETGLRDFGNEKFREPLRILLRALDEEAALHDLGRFSVRTSILQLLRTRLRLVDLLRRHPQILRQEIEQPIFVVGLPRTGTTLLHNLLSRHPELRYLPYWESMEPLPRSAAAEPDGDVEERRATARRGLDFLNKLAPFFPAMHEMECDLPHEEIQLLAVEFSTMLFETAWQVPAYRRWYMTTDQSSAYAGMKVLLQAMQWLRGGDRWLLKSPQHLEQLPVLLRIFPDARVIQTHRDPWRVLLSMAMMSAYTARMNSLQIDPRRIGRVWLDRIESMLHTAVRDRAALPAESFFDVRFGEYMADNIGMAERVLHFAGEPASAAGREQMKAFLRDHPRGKYGQVEYDAAQLGLDRDRVRERLGFYQERFDVPDE